MFSPLELRNAALWLSIATITFTNPVHGVPSSSTNGLTLDHSTEALSLNPRIDIPPSLAKFPSGPLNQFLRLISTLPEGAVALDALGKILTPLQQGLADTVGIDTTRDNLAKNAACADVTVVFARGTTEPGNVGLVTGPPFFDALKEELGGRTLAVQGVEYPATFAGFNRNGTDGVPSM